MLDQPGQAGTTTLCGLGNRKRPPVEAGVKELNCLWRACRTIDPPPGGAGIEPGPAKPRKDAS